MLHQSIKSWKPIWWHSDLSFLPPPTALDFPLDNTSTSLPGAVTLLARLWFQGVECRHEQTPIPKEKRLFHSTMSTVQYIIPGSMDHWWWGHTLQHPVMRTWGTWTLLSRWPPVVTIATYFDTHSSSSGILMNYCRCTMQMFIQNFLMVAKWHSI